MNIYKNGVEVSEYTTSYSNKAIAISIDSSKSNSALVVWDEFGNPLDDYEISGAGSETDVYDLCAFTRVQLYNLFKGANIFMVGIENIITKNEKGYKGIEIHQSRYKITAVFDNFIFFFDVFFKRRPILINNQEWKAGVLPEEYRHRDHKKGSKDWFDTLNNRWTGRKDDVTDAVCIGLYMFKTHKEIKCVHEIKETAPTKYEYNAVIIPTSMTIPKECKEFVINNTDTLEHNLQTIANNVDVGQLGVVKVDTALIPIEWIYSDRLRFDKDHTYPRDTREVYLVITRK
jgi:hypothetical protein